MTVSEPMTLITDLLLAALTFVLARRLARAERDGQTSVRLWSLAFYASAAAALCGGVFHGLRPHLAPAAAMLLWKGTVYAVGLAGLFLFSGAVYAAFAGIPRRLLLAFAAGKFLLYAGWMATHNAFRYVVYDYAPTLFIVLALQAVAWVRRREPAAPWIVAGIAVSFLAAAVQVAGLAPHPNFNHNDLYHVIQMGAFWLLYRGGLLLKDRQ